MNFFPATNEKTFGSFLFFKSDVCMPQKNIFILINGKEILKYEKANADERSGKMALALPASNVFSLYVLPGHTPTGKTAGSAGKKIISSKRNSSCFLT
jgi:hypothetical protein